ncbi:MAG: hypothetical protein CMF75_07880 [Maricaulis sp.]|nr:hypothetical protein [Maricaulis sp.]
MTRESEHQADPLAAFFEAGDVASVDPAFRVDVMEAVARRRFRISLAIRAAILAGLVLVAALLMPVINHVAAALGAPLLEILVILLATGLVAYAARAWLQRHPALPHVSWRRFRIF